MTRSQLIRAWAMAAAVGAAVPAATLIAGPIGGDEAGAIKDIMCSAAQCSRGDRKCADVKGELKDPTGRGTVSVTWYCYEGVVGGGEWAI